MTEDFPQSVHYDQVNQGEVLSLYSSVCTKKSILTKKMMMIDFGALSSCLVWLCGFIVTTLIAVYFFHS